MRSMNDDLDTFLKNVFTLIGQRLFEYFTLALKFGLQVHDLNFNIRWSNHAIASMLGYPYVEYIGKNSVRDMIAPYWQKIFMENVYELGFKRGYTDPYVVDCIRKDQSIIKLYTQGTFIWDASGKKPIGSFSIFYDVSREAFLHDQLKTFMTSVSSYIDRSPAINADRIARNYNLTQSQYEVFKLLSEGRSSKDIADQLNISIHTVNSHRKHIREKLGLKGSEMTVYNYFQSLILDD